MFVSEEKAKLIAELSYEEYEHYKNKGIEDAEKCLITYKKALEFDKDTADKILEKLVNKSNEFKLKEFASLNAGLVKYIGDGIKIINNYQYVDYYRYELGNSNSRARLEIKFVDGNSHFFFLTNPDIKGNGAIPDKPAYVDSIYIPHIYEPLFIANEKREFETYNIVEMEMYLKLLIIEDRMVSPYIYSNGKMNKKVILPMKEKLEFLWGYEDDVLFLDNLLKTTGGFLIFDISTGFLKVEPLIEYLEYIKNPLLIDLLSEYNNKEKLERLNYMLEIADKGIYGVVLEGISNWHTFL